MVPEAVSVPGNAPTKFVLHSYDQFQEVRKNCLNSCQVSSTAWDPEIWVSEKKDGTMEKLVGWTWLLV